MSARAASSLLVLALTACNAPGPARQAAAPQAPADSVVRVSTAEARQLIRVRAGGRLEVALAGNPTTGYVWQRDGGDTTVLAPAGEPRYTPDAAAPGVAGSGGTEVLSFRAVAPGKTRLVLVSRQPWQGGATSGARWEAEVEVQP
jgi:predicted secreted protein